MARHLFYSQHTRDTTRLVRILLDISTVDTSAEDRRGLTALQLAAFNGNEKVESLLATSGVQIVPDFYGLQALFGP